MLVSPSFRWPVSELCLLQRTIAMKLFQSGHKIRLFRLTGADSVWQYARNVGLQPA
jgi:hypothetical protein